jgi:tetratricopeptide (TPR) repeat protein
VAQNLSDGRRLLEASRGLWLALGEDRLRPNLAWTSFMQGDYPSARRFYEEEVERAHQSDDSGHLAHAYYRLATVQSAQGDYKEAARLFEEALRLHETATRQSPGRLHESPESLRWRAAALHNMAENFYRMGDHRRARALFVEAYALYPTPSEGGKAGHMIHQALPTYWLGEHAEARALMRKGLATARGLGDLRVLAEGLEGLAEMAAAEGHPGRAVRLLGAAQSVRETADLHFRFMPQSGYDGLIAALRQTLGRPAFTAAWEGGRALSWRQAADEALAE